MYISDNFLKFSVNELLKLRHIWKINTCIVLHMWQLKHYFHLSHLYIHKHRRAHTDTHTHIYTHTHTLTLTHIKILQLFGKIAE